MLHRPPRTTTGLLLAALLAGPVALVGCGSSSAPSAGPNTDSIGGLSPQPSSSSTDTSPSPSNGDRPSVSVATSPLPASIDIGLSQIVDNAVDGTVSDGHIVAIEGPTTGPAFSPPRILLFDLDAMQPLATTVSLVATCGFGVFRAGNQDVLVGVTQHTTPAQGVIKASIDNEYVGIDPRSGRRLWAVKGTDDTCEDAPIDHQGVPLHSAATSDGAYLVLSTGQVVNMATGATAQIPGTSGKIIAPVGKYVGAYSTQSVATNLTIFDPVTNRRVSSFTFQRSPSRYQTFHATNNILFGPDGSGISLPSGAALYKNSAINFDTGASTTLDAASQTALVQYSSDSSDPGGLTAVDILTGKKKWSVPTSSQLCGVLGKTVYVEANGALAKLDAATGAQRTYFSGRECPTVVTGAFVDKNQETGDFVLSKTLISKS